MKNNSPIITSFVKFKECIRRNSYRSSFNNSVRRGYDLLYGFKGINFIEAKTMSEAYNYYKANFEKYDANVLENSFLLDDVNDKHPKGWKDAKLGKTAIKVKTGIMEGEYRLTGYYFVYQPVDGDRLFAAVSKEDANAVGGCGVCGTIQLLDNIEILDRQVWSDESAAAEESSWARRVDRDIDQMRFEWLHSLPPNMTVKEMERMNSWAWMKNMLGSKYKPDWQDFRDNF